MAVRKSEVGTFSLQKGHIKGVSVFSLDCASYCSGDKCPLAKACTYEKKGYCTLELRWIKAAFAPFMELMKRVPSSFLSQIVGMQIMPLYRHLIILHKQQMALSEDEIVQVPEFGLKKVHPIFDEIRRTSAAIMAIMARANVLQLAEQAGLLDILNSTPPRPEPGDDSEIDEEEDEAFNLTYGDPGHLDAVIGGK